MAEDLLRERSVDLFKFLQALTELRTKSIRTLDEYDKIIWFEHIPQSGSLHCPIPSTVGSNSTSFFE